jgi:hypothetical protein
MCVRVHAYVCVHVYVCMYICECMYVCVYMCVCMYACVCLIFQASSFAACLFSNSYLWETFLLFYYIFFIFFIFNVSSSDTVLNIIFKKQNYGIQI